MSSFVRTIRKEETPEYVEKILGRTEHWVPLKFVPRRAFTGDYIYLAYRGKLVGRVRITKIEQVDKEYLITSKQITYDSKSLVHYSTEWERPPRIILYKGHQGIRYIEQERW
jgi:hypothetical protein